MVNRWKRRVVCYLGLTSIIGLLLLGGLGAGAGVPAPPNDSLVTGVVLGYAILNSRVLDIQPEQVLHALWLEVQQAQDVPGLPNFVQRHIGEILQVLTKEPLSPYLFGRTVQGHVQLVGDERGRRFWINDVQVLEQAVQTGSQGP